MPNLIDILSDEDKAKVESWKKERAATRIKRPNDIPDQLYLIAELGYYYGWPAIEAVKRGYIPSVEPDGSVHHIAFTFDEMFALLKAAQKVKYRKMVEEGEIRFSASQAHLYNGKHPDRAYDDMVKGFRERAK